MRKIFFVFLLITGLSYGFSEKERDTLLRVIQGLYKDGVYSTAAQKGLEYLQKASEDDPYREKIIKLIFSSLYKAGDKKQFLKYIDEIKNQKISPETAEYIYILGLKLFKNSPEKTKIIQFYIPFAPEDKQKALYKELAIIYAKAKKWKEIEKLPDIKELRFFKVLALYKQKKYKEVIEYTQQLGKFPPETKEKVLYYRALSFTKINQPEKAVKELEAITFKTPDMLKFLAGYYLKKKNYIMAERYLKQLTTEEKYKDFAYYYLGVIQDLDKNYKKAAKYYLKAAKYKSKYGKLAQKRLQQFKKAKVLSEYSVRVAVFSTEDKARKLLQKLNLKECFVKKYKKYYGVFCGKSISKEELKPLQKKIKSKGIKDSIITQLP
ncbi:SPOR domain-containing protein [Persephonella sp. KM09-Lau-8]|uniref:SPOR domain-containing protein n=1 Tax=Persephonella sp. KM09-Lau-8 TaxID=1158345 RepID=UPI000495EEE2|nr:SPOR domain-containing protein [Persephonella sp. KM09-Lau-8]